MADPGPDSGDSLPPQLARLPSGRHGLPREFVAANHRDRLLAACAQEVRKHGYTDTTVASVIKTAAVSRRTFYEFFDSKEDCFLAVYDLLLEYIQGLVMTAFEREEEWPERVRAGLAAMLGFLASEPDLARLFMLEPFVAGPPISEHHREGLAGFAPILEGGRKGRRKAEQPPSGTEEAVIAGIASLIARRVAVGKAANLSDLLPDVVDSALTPFLGSAEAERIARE